jgi:hypothetical protein
MPNQLLRYAHVRRADTLDDQKSAANIVGADGASVTQEDLQEYVLSQIKRIIFGNSVGNWFSDFIGDGILPLKDLSAAIVSLFTPLQHRVLRQLIHFIDEGPAAGFPTGALKEILPSGVPFPTTVIWWEDVAKTKRIVDKIITRNLNQSPATIQWRMYAVDGSTVIETVVDTLTYSGPFVTTRNRAIF